MLKKRIFIYVCLQKVLNRQIKKYFFNYWQKFGFFSYFCPLE